MTVLLRDLRISAGSCTVACDMLEIQDNEYLVLLGPTGAGKTVLLETIAGFRAPDSGTIMLDGTDIVPLPPEQRSFSLVHQDHLLFPHMTVRQNIAYGLEVTGHPRDETTHRVDDITRYLDINHLVDRSVDGLSGGERQVICLARAVISSPRFLLLDEPLGATDPLRRGMLETKLKQLHRGLGCPAIHVCHDFGEASRLADRIAVMINGTLCAIGSAETIFRTPPRIEVARFLGHRNIYRTAGREEEAVLTIPEHGDGTSPSPPVPLTAASQAGEAEHLLICAEDIEIVPRDKHGWTWNNNSFKGTITEIVEFGSHQQVQVSFGLQAVAHLSHREVRDKGLAAGQEVLITIPPEAVHLF